MTKKEKIIKDLDSLSIEDWADVVGAGANSWFQKLRHTNSNAATFHEISRQCNRLRKILKRVTIA